MQVLLSWGCGSCLLAAIPAAHTHLQAWRGNQGGEIRFRGCGSLTSLPISVAQPPYAPLENPPPAARFRLAPPGFGVPLRGGYSSHPPPRSPAAG